MKAEKGVILVILLCVTLIILGYVTYMIIYIRSSDIKISELSNFASYNGYFISLCNLLLIGMIAYLTLETTNSYNNLQTTPLLDLTVDQDSWYLINSSNAAARNISVRFGFNRYENKFTQWVACYSLNGNEKISLSWLRFADVIEVIYEDAFSRKFYR